MKIAILLPDLGGGGAERLALNLANDWITKGHQVEFILMNRRGELLPLLPPKCHVIDLQVRKIRNVVLPLAQYLRRNRIDLLWAKMWPLTSAAVIAHQLAGRPCKLFLTDHNHLSTAIRHELHKSTMFASFVMRLTYRFADGVTAVSQSVADDLGALSGLTARRINVIYNPAARGHAPGRASAEVRSQLWGDGFEHHILSVGILKFVKNHPLHIRAFKRVVEQLNAKLIILGEGAMRSELEKLIADLNLVGRVELPGYHIDPYPWFQSADLFVLSSDHEGFGNVLVEAMECGVPVVSTHCPGGPAEVLGYGRYGRLVSVGDEQALAAAMQESLTSTHDHDALVRRSRDFLIDDIADQYLQLFAGPKVR